MFSFIYNELNLNLDKLNPNVNVFNSNITKYKDYIPVREGVWKSVKENGDYWKEIFSNVFFVSQSLEQFVLQILDSSSGLKSW